MLQTSLALFLQLSTRPGPTVTGPALSLALIKTGGSEALVLISSSQFGTSDARSLLTSHLLPTSTTTPLCRSFSLSVSTAAGLILLDSKAKDNGGEKKYKNWPRFYESTNLHAHCQGSTELSSHVKMVECIFLRKESKSKNICSSLSGVSVYLLWWRHQLNVGTVVVVTRLMCSRWRLIWVTQEAKRKSSTKSPTSLWPLP